MRRWPKSLAGQTIALHVIVITFVVAIGATLALFDARRDGENAARDQVLAVAIALADAPSTASAIESGQATPRLQPVTELVRKSADIAFITIMAPNGIRFTHTDPAEIGRPYLGTIAPALRGQTFTEIYPGTLGPSVRAVAPVHNAEGLIVGLVSAGVTLATLTQRWQRQIPVIALVGAGALAVSLLGTLVIRRRLLRQTHGLAPDELRVMYDHHDAILHAVSEGLIVLDDDRVVVVNDEGRRLLGLGSGSVRRDDLPEFLRTSRTAARDEVRVTEDRVLVVNSSLVPRSNAEVITLRDRTELQGALGEIGALKSLTDSLRAQAHEASNKLHTIITMVEMGRPADAVQFATDELAMSQGLVDRLSNSVGEPALVALLLGKSAQAAERGIVLAVTAETSLPAASSELPLTPAEIVTVVGNLIDNAMDACDRDDPWVEVTIRFDNGTLYMSVADSGPGMDEQTFARAMQRGYSTKGGGDHQGLGLALVAQVVRRHGGSLTADRFTSHHGATTGDTFGSSVTASIGEAT